jgi:acetylornithine deacetylase/succinyl-diaminopimelate desuccinylase-like protein
MDEPLQRLLDMVDEAQDELVALHQELVRIPTVNTGAADSGHETELCRFLEGRFNAEGIPNLTLESAPGRGNFAAHIGDQARPRLLLMSHSDVVPIEDENKWDLPPFCAEIVDGKVYGRGSDDCKGLVATQAMALVLLKRAKVSLQGELRFLATADEESGGRYGIAWLADHHPDEIRADWAINEGGGSPVETTDGVGYLFALGEKGRIEARFTFSGRSAHAARPWYADNALYKLAELLKRLEAYPPDIDVSTPIFQFLHLFDVRDQVTPENLEALLENLSKKDQPLARRLTGMSRMSVTPTVTGAGAKSNSIPSQASLTCDIRNLPHQDEAYVRHELDKLMEGIEGVCLELDVWAVPNASPADSPFVAHMRRATEWALGGEDVVLIPSLTVGFTDSRCVRPLGTQVYGFGPIVPGSDTARAGVHGVNEVMEIENLVLRTKMQVALAYLALGGAGD